MSGVSGDEILVVNAGSTSLKLHLVNERERARALPEGGMEQVQGVRAVVHRVVHGGERFRDPVLIDAELLEQIFELERVAPLHNAPALRGIERTMQLLPDIPQVAVFDTGFHRTIPPEASTYALPREFRERWGVRRYGFHGLSLQWCAQRVPELLGTPEPTAEPGEGLRLVVCHLGGGCSVSALRGGSSLDTTMGFTPLDGVPMGTRSGSVDPGALTYLLRERRLGVEQLERALELDSGLRGLGGGSGDMQELERAAARGSADARFAIEVFCYRVAGAVGAMTTATQGVDALAFTGGMGEGSKLVRERICMQLRFLGVQLDGERNASAEPDTEVSAEGSQVRVMVIRAREELIAARAARALLADS